MKILPPPAITRLVVVGWTCTLLADGRVLRRLVLGLVGLLAISCSAAPSLSPTDSSSSPSASPSPTGAPTPTATAVPTFALSGSCANVNLPAGRIAFTAGELTLPQLGGGDINPDGKANGIALVKSDGSGYQVLVEPKRIANQPHGGTEGPSWVGSDRILFDSNRNGGPDDWHLFSVGASGGDPVQITSGPDGIENHPVQSRDGIFIVFTKYLATGNPAEPWGGGGIFVAGPDGENERQVTEMPPGGVDEWPDISPDGKRIAFMRGHVDDGGLFVVNVDGSDLTRIVPAKLEPSRPRWSAEGSRIVFHSNGHRFLTASSNVWVVNPDGSGLRQLTFENRDGQAFFPNWSPDDQFLVFVHHLPGSPTNDLAVMPSAGGVACTLWQGTSSNLAWESDWAP